METPPGAGYCIACGERLEPGHRFCWSCGAERWIPPPANPVAARPPPSPGTPPLLPSRQPGAVAPPVQATPVPGLAWLYGAGAVVWLISLAQLGGFLAASKGRAQLIDQLVKGGYSAADAGTLLWVYGAVMIGLTVAAAGLHATAFYGLRARRRWGWLAAVTVAGAWSLVLVGIPVLAVLLRPSTRRAYGVG
ncbi:MAG TPA: zinc ribbon domain-containing protein [Candidatus Dormibacteraeota bacterium]